jgi:predicted GNAT family acetyltransferase
MIELPAAYVLRDDLSGIDWEEVKRDLAIDDFDNGRTPHQLAESFRRSYAVAIVWRDGKVIGTARIIADGVCNAYLVDVWTKAGHRRQGIGASMVVRLLETVPGHHVILQTDVHEAFYRELGFKPVGGAMELVVGRWLHQDDGLTG